MEAVATGQFDAALVDYDLDDGKGDQLIRSIRVAGFNAPIVAVSARDEGNLAMTDAGADAVCPKQSFARIEHAIQRAQDALERTLCRVHFEPPRAGWSRMIVISGSDRIELDASYTPRDSLGELAGSLLALLQSNSEANVAFNAEPAVTVLKLLPIGDQVELRLERSSRHGGHEDTATLMLRRRASKREAVLAFYRPFRVLQRVVSPDLYEREWRHAFPARALERIEEALGKDT
ncbi:Hypothetical protein A7982_04218 [Minicystis rosea]|nr:Hypothetical protein A7982_04218 [Minicystis rosea]